MASVIDAGEAIIRLFVVRLHWLNSSAAWRSWPRRLGGQRDYSGGRCGSPADRPPCLVAARQQTAGAAGDIGHVRAA
jgi:hypothetical protein